MHTARRNTIEAVQAKCTRLTMALPNKFRPADESCTRPPKNNTKQARHPWRPLLWRTKKNNALEDKFLITKARRTNAEQTATNIVDEISATRFGSTMKMGISVNKQLELQQASLTQRPAARATLTAPNSWKPKSRPQMMPRARPGRQEQKNSDVTILGYCN